MLQELALAAAAWSAAAIDNTWFALEAYCCLVEVADERIAAGRPSFDNESISVDELTPGQRVAVRVADSAGRPQFLMGCVEEVADEQIVLSRSVSDDVELLFCPPDWAEGLPYVGEHWGHYAIRHTLEYRGVSVVPYAAALKIEEAHFPDWIALGNMPWQICEGGSPNTWYLAH